MRAQKYTSDNLVPKRILFYLRAGKLRMGRGVGRRGARIKRGNRLGCMDKEETYQEILACMYFNDLVYQIRLHLLF